MGAKTYQDMENGIQRNQRIALTLVEQCKRESGVTVWDLKDIFERASRLIVIGDQ